MPSVSVITTTREVNPARLLSLPPPDMNLSVAPLRNCSDSTRPPRLPPPLLRHQVPVPGLLDRRQDVLAPLVAGHVHVGQAADHRLADLEQVIQQRDHEAGQRLAGLRGPGGHTPGPAAASPPRRTTGPCRAGGSSGTGGPAKGPSGMTISSSANSRIERRRGGLALAGTNADH